MGMEFLFETVVLSFDIPVYYRICLIDADSYFAELMEGQEDEAYQCNFYFYRLHRGWITDNEYQQRQAEQIGDLLEKKYFRIC